MNKEYDGTTSATVTLADNRVGGDVVTAAYTSASFADKNVGTGKPVSVSGITHQRGRRGQLHALNTTASATANITPRDLTVSATGVEQGSMTGRPVATVTLATTRIGGDVVTAAYTSASFADKNVGNGKTVTRQRHHAQRGRRGQLHAGEHDGQRRRPTSRRAT